MSIAFPFEKPLLSPLEYHAFSFFLTALYVGSIYISKFTTATAHSTPKHKELGRNHPDVIKARMKAVLGATTCCVFGIWGIVQWGLETQKGNQNVSPYPSMESFLPTWSLLGFPLSLPTSPLPISELYSAEPGRFLSAFFLPPSPLVPFMLAPILFLGPLFTDVALEKIKLQDAWEGLTSFVGVRNYLVAPLTEEIVFRACTIALAQLSGASWKHQVFVTPLWFGLAHAHHAYDVYTSNGRTSQALKVALGSSAFQFAYTTLFGWFAAYLFVTTGSILPPLSAHIFCNVMSLPTISYALQKHPERKWDILATYMLGVVGFCWLLPKI